MRIQLQRLKLFICQFQIVVVRAKDLRLHSYE